MQTTTESVSKFDIVVSDDEPPLLQESAFVPSAPHTPPESLSLKLTRLSTAAPWRDWRWHMRNRIRSLSKLVEYFPNLDVTPEMARAEEKFPMAISPYYASLIRKTDASDPVFRMAIPSLEELYDPPFLCDDPLEEDRDMPVPGLVHRYEDRALLLATSACATYCRHCTRKRVTGKRECCISVMRLRRAVDYLLRHPEIRDVIVSGGDPFTLPTETIETILVNLRCVPSLDIIRFGTRTPVTLPFRITDNLVRTLRKYQPVWVNTHFNHPNELTADAVEACGKLVDAGIPVGNQAVLLRNVNDDPLVMEELLRGLVRARVRPYYLFQCDLVPGVEHFRTPLSRGVEIMEALRGRLSGIAIPAYVVDMPHGGGKVPVLPNYIVSTSPTHTVLRNYEGMLATYPEPVRDAAPATAPEGAPSRTQTVWDLATGRASRIQPQNTSRQQRRRMISPFRQTCFEGFLE